MIKEHRRWAKEILRITSDFAAFLERNPKGLIDIWDVKSLPHDKDAILNAICLEIVAAGASPEDDGRVDALKNVAVILADFQEGVGDKPLSEVGVDLESALASIENDDDLFALARQIGDNPERERFEALQPLVRKNRQEILTTLAGAEQMRRMPKDVLKDLLEMPKDMLKDHLEKTLASPKWYNEIFAKIALIALLVFITFQVALMVYSFGFLIWTQMLKFGSFLWSWV